MVASSSFEKLKREFTIYNLYDKVLNGNYKNMANVKITFHNPPASPRIYYNLGYYL